MKDIFMCLLLNLAQHGKIIEANMYKDGTYSNVTIKNDNGTYKIGVIKEDDSNENKENENE